jgi:hypothetical protein
MKTCKSIVLIASFLFINCLPNTSFAEKKIVVKSLPAQVEDEKKFELVKGNEEDVWTCENNVTVRTSKSSNGYFLLWNKKMYSLLSVDALNGVSHYKDSVNLIDWIIIPNKAMLFDTKAGHRLLDYCKIPSMKNAVLSQETDLMK